jgi:hypothetical protein
MLLNRQAGLVSNKARQAIRELERRCLLSHRRRNSVAGRGVDTYLVLRTNTGFDTK